MDPRVQQFIDNLPAGRKVQFMRLQELVLDLYPEAKIVLSYQVPTYKVGKGWVALGYWKDGVSIYTNNPDFIAEFKARHPNIKTNKASINIRTDQELPLEDLRTVINRAIEAGQQLT